MVLGEGSGGAVCEMTLIGKPCIKVSVGTDSLQVENLFARNLRSKISLRGVCSVLQRSVTV